MSRKNLLSGKSERFEQKIKTIGQQILRLENSKNKEIQRIRNSLGLSLPRIHVPLRPKVSKHLPQASIEDYLKNKNEFSKGLFYLLREKELRLGEIVKFVKGH